MVTVHRAHGYRFVIYTNDHSPAHVHIVGNGGEAKIVLDGPEGLALDWVVGINRGDLRMVMAEVQAQRDLLIEAWSRIHG